MTVRSKGYNRKSLEKKLASAGWTMRKARSELRESAARAGLPIPRWEVEHENGAVMPLDTMFHVSSFAQKLIAREVIDAEHEDKDHGERL